MNMSKAYPQILLLSCLGVVPFACTIDDPCDPGTVLYQGFCWDPAFVPTGGTTGTGGEATGGMGGDAASGGMGGDAASGGMGGDSGDGTGGSEDGTGGTDGPDEEPNFGAACTEQSQCKGGATCYLDVGGVCGGYCGPGDEFEEGCPGTDTYCSEVIAGVFVCMLPM